MKKRQSTVNKDQELYVLPSGKDGYSCLGFDVFEQRASRLGEELTALGHYVPKAAIRGTLARLEQYNELVELARQENIRTGWRSTSELTPELMGLEGKRVEVDHRWPDHPAETCRLYVGKSTGFIPCHLAIARRNCIGGAAVCLGEILGVRVLY